MAQYNMNCFPEKCTDWISSFGLKQKFWEKSSSKSKCYVSCILSRKPRSFLTKKLAQKVQQELPLCTRLFLQSFLCSFLWFFDDCLLVFTIESDFKRFAVLDLHLDDAVQLIVGHVNNLIILS